MGRLISRFWRPRVKDAELMTKLEVQEFGLPLKDINGKILGKMGNRHFSRYVSAENNKSALLDAASLAEPAAARRLTIELSKMSEGQRRDLAKALDKGRISDSAIPAMGRRGFLKYGAVGAGLVALSALGTHQIDQVFASPAPSVGWNMDSGSLEEVGSYIIYTDLSGPTFLARNGQNGKNDFSNSDAATTVNQALGSVGGGAVFIKKYPTISSFYTISTPMAITPANNGIAFQGEGSGGSLYGGRALSPINLTGLQPGGNNDVIQVNPSGSSFSGFVAGIQIRNFQFSDASNFQTSTGMIRVDNATGSLQDGLFENLNGGTFNNAFFYSTIALASIDTSHVIAAIFDKMNSQSSSRSGITHFKLYGSLQTWILRTTLSFLGTNQIGFDIENGSVNAAFGQGIFLEHDEINTNAQSGAIAMKLNGTSNMWLNHVDFDDLAGDAIQFNNQNRSFYENACIVSIASGGVGHHWLATAVDGGFPATIFGVTTLAPSLTPVGTAFKSETGDTSNKIILGGDVTTILTAMSPDPLTNAEVYGLRGYNVGSTGSTTNTLGANGPNSTTTPFTWLKVNYRGNVCYIPVWK